MSSRPVTEFSTPLLKTKISVPRLPGEFIHRPRLTDRINQGVKGPLTLLTAPAGSYSYMPLFLYGELPCFQINSWRNRFLDQV